MAALSYTADNTDESNRSLRIGIVESMIYLGSMIGFLISGVWKDSSGGKWGSYSRFRNRQTFCHSKLHYKTLLWNKASLAEPVSSQVAH